MTDRLETQTALIYVMVATSAVDGDMADAELDVIGRIVETSPVFRGFPADALITTAQACGALVAGEDGLKALLDAVDAGLPIHLHETAYALAVETAAADRSVAPEEVRFLDHLRRRLDVPRLTAVAIETAARIRHRGLS